MLEVNLDFRLLGECLKCGACYHVCPSSLNIEGYDPRAVIKDILAGEYKKWLGSKHIWQCLECHQCLEMCFQHYGFENAMTAMRAVATRMGANPPQVKRGWDTFIKTGRLGEPSPKRKKLNMPELKASGSEELHTLLALYNEANKPNKKVSANE